MTNGLLLISCHSRIFQVCVSLVYQSTLYSTKPYHRRIFFGTPWGSEHTGRFREHQLPCYWNLYLSCRSETTLPILPTVHKQYCPVQSDLGHTCVNAPPPEVNFIVAVAFVILQEIPRLINGLSHHLSVRVISVTVLMYTSAIHRLQRRRFPKLNGMNENIPPPPVPPSRNSIKMHHKSTSLLAVQLPCVFHNKTHRSVYWFLFTTHLYYKVTSESTSLAPLTGHIIPIGLQPLLMPMECQPIKPTQLA